MIDIENIRKMVKEYDFTPKILIVSSDIFIKYRDEIEDLGVTFMVDDRLDKETKAVVMNMDIFDAIYYLEKGSDNK